MQTQWAPFDLCQEDMWKHIRYLAQECPRRFSGTDNLRKAAEYITTQLRISGVTTNLKQYFGYGSIPIWASLRLLKPEERQISCIAIAYSQNLSDGGYQLVDVGDGSEEEFHKESVSGKIILANAYAGPGTPEKARLAQSFGAIGMILVTWPTPDPELATYRAFKGIWGNPDRSAFTRIPQICAATVGYRDGQELRRLILHGTCEIELHTKCDTRWVPLFQPVAEVRALKPTEDFILVTGHLDVWDEGASDNGTGIALMIELAKYFQRNRDLLCKNIIFPFYDGHEILEDTGSSCLLEECWDQFRDHGVLELNIDNPGLSGATFYRTFASYELADAIEEIHKRLEFSTLPVQPITRDSDRSYMAVGLPGFLTIEQGEDSHEGFPFYWWEHTRADTLEKLDSAVLIRSSNLFAEYIRYFAGENRFPYHMAQPATVLCETLQEVVGACGKKIKRIDFEPIIKSAVQFQAFCAELDQNVDDMQAFNRQRMLLQAMGPVLYTASGRYQQDNYGDIRYEHPMPLLDPLRKIACVEENTQEYYLLYTECVRIRNFLSDFFQKALNNFHSDQG